MGRTQHRQYRRGIEETIRSKSLFQLPWIPDLAPIEDGLASPPSPYVRHFWPLGAG